MVESLNSKDIDVMLGYLEEPKNELIVAPRFLPSKVGGAPVSTIISILTS